MLFRYDRAGKLTVTTRADGSKVYTADLAVPDVFAYRDADGKTYLEYTPPEVLNDPEYLASVANSVITLDHPDELVTPENVRALNVGNLGDAVNPSVNGSAISAQMFIRDAKALQEVESGARCEVSCGYAVEIDYNPGHAPSGKRFDRKQTKRTQNHTALVARGRHGARARVRKDAAEQIDPEESIMLTPAIQARLDAAGIKETDPQKAIEALLVLEKARADKEAARADVADVKRTEAETALQTEKQARADAAKSPLNLDAYKEVAPLVSRAQALDLEIKGTPADLRKAIVLKVYPNLKTDKSDDYYQAILDNEQPRNPYKSGSTDFVPDLSKNDGANDPLVVEPPPKFK